MSFGGSVQAMINSVKYNRSMLRGHNTFGRLRDQYRRGIDYHGKANRKKISPQQLALVREEIRKQAKKDRLRRILLTWLSIAIAFTIVFFFYVWVNNSTNQPDVLTQEILNNYEKEKLKKKLRKQEQLNFYIADGYERLSKKEFNNAHYQFNLAVQYSPQSNRAQLGFIISLIEKCRQLGNSCREAERWYDHAVKEVNDSTRLKKELAQYILENQLSQYVDISVDEKHLNPPD